MGGVLGVTALMLCIRARLLVGPLRATKILALAPALFLCKVSVAVGVLLGSIDESCFDRVLNERFAMLQHKHFAQDAP